MPRRSSLVAFLGAAAEAAAREGLAMSDVQDSPGVNQDLGVPPGRGEKDLADRERRADQRETALDAREAHITAAEAAVAAQKEKVRQMVSRGTQRDGDADQRDWLAGRRDMTANLNSFLSRDDPDQHDGASARRAQRFAAHDREDSKRDRTGAANDRSQLAEDGGTHHAAT
jgi:hypothetical protein